MNWPALEQEATAQGAVASWTRDHWIIKGKYIVDYWPLAGVVYVRGTTGKPVRFVNGPGGAIDAATQLPPIVPIRYRHKRKVLAEAQSIKRALFRRNSFCSLCGARLSYAEATLEHVIPLIRGGTNDPINMALACKPCNERKGIS